MQGIITKKSLALFISFALTIGMFSLVEATNLKVSAKTVGSYTINFAADGETATCAGTGAEEISASIESVGDELNDWGYVVVCATLSGTLSNSGRINVDLRGDFDNNTDQLINGNAVYVKDNTTLDDNITIDFGIPVLTTGDIENMYLVVEYMQTDVYEYNLMSSPQTLNGVDATFRLNWSQGIVGDGCVVGEHAYLEFDGVTALAGTYTVSASSTQGAFNYSATTPLVPAGETYYWYEFDNQFLFTMPSNDITDIQYGITFTPQAPINSSGGSSSDSGNSASVVTTPTLPTSSNVSANGSVSASAIQSDLKSALKTSDDTASVSVKNAETISAATIKDLAASADKANKEVIIKADTTNPDGSIQGRLYLDPSKLTGVTADLKLGVFTDSKHTAAVQDKFAKYYTNQIATVHCEQSGSFGAPIKMAVKLDLSKLDTKALVFYSFDSKTNTFSKIENTNYTIDKNGFLQFTTAKANNIIITDKPFTKK